MEVLKNKMGKHIPTRKCIGCSAKKEKHTLVRIVSFKNKCEIDISKNKDGRGTYICKNEACLKASIKKNLLKKIFKKSFDDNILLDLEKYIKDE